jgi:hypothetical protein
MTSRPFFLSGRSNCIIGGTEFIPGETEFNTESMFYDYKQLFMLRRYISILEGHIQYMWQFLGTKKDGHSISATPDPMP